MLRATALTNPRTYWQTNDAIYCSNSGVISEIIAGVARFEIVPGVFRTVANRSKEKTSAFDIVTNADEAAEREIAARLLKASPHAVIIGEEAAGRDPKLLDQIFAPRRCGHHHSKEEDPRKRHSWFH